jgi:hypothetical protein
MTAPVPRPARPATRADVQRVYAFVDLINDGTRPSDAIEQIGFEEHEVFPEDPCLTLDDSDLIDFTPLATDAAALVVRRSSPRANWVVEATYR